MKKILILCSLLFTTLWSQYHSQSDLTSLIKRIASQNPNIVKIASLTKTKKGNDLWIVTIGKNESNKAILVVGGIQATQIAGSEYALRLIEFLVHSYGTVDSVKSLLENTTIFVIPRANPDATESYFIKPVEERETNYTPFDDDRDGETDEDGPEDLNGDGIITMMRVTDPRGEWIENPDDPRLMKKAEAAKGEKGMYRMMTEGIDNDKDEEWNEDAPGGTDYNKNYTFNYQFFGRNSGIHQISENETKAIADFVFDHQNINIIFSFSENDNLTVPWKNEPQRGDSPHITSVVKDDEEYFGSLSKKFGGMINSKDAPKPVKGEGSFSEWAYYHAGRWSVSVRPWWAGEITKDTAQVKDTTKRLPNLKKNEKGKSDDPAIKTLQWYDAAGIKDIFVPWMKYKHPDFPDHIVEIGGIKPFLLTNPPGDSLNAYATPFANYVVCLAQQLPKIELSNQRVEKMGSNVYRVSVDVVNAGFLPTNNSMGVKTRAIRNIRLIIEPGKGSVVSSGTSKQTLGPIRGSGGYETVSWIVVGNGDVKITAESPTSGKAELKVPLR